MSTPRTSKDRPEATEPQAEPETRSPAMPAPTEPRPGAAADARVDARGQEVAPAGDPLVAPAAPRSGDGGRLPDWATVAVYGVVAAIAVLLLVATDIAVGLLVVGAVVIGGLVLGGWSRAVEGRRRATDRIATIGLSSAVLVALAPLVSLMWTVISKGAERFNGDLFTENTRNVIGGGGGANHAIIGTLVVTGLASVVSVPIGILAAIYLQEYGKGRLRKALTFFVDVMTGIPSIVAGLFALALFQALFGPGTKLGVMGAVALSVLMIPIVVRSTEEMLRVVPYSLREASYALGVPKWKTITSIVLPTALAGIVTGVMLAVARVIGETAPLLITTGVIDSTNWNPFDGRMQTLPVFAYNSFTNPGAIRQPYIDRAWAAALTLILIVVALNVIARLVYRFFGTDLNKR